MTPLSRKLHAATALTPDGWAHDVAVDISADGRIAAVRSQSDPAGADERVAVLLPALCNLHSHAFQRALAGLTQRRGPGDDDFWSWREAMYRFQPRLGPDEIEAVAALAFAELLEGGFSAVAEFHYVHNDPDGRPYADPAETASRIAAAAAGTGLGLTLLPVFYAQGGFGGEAPNDGQKRFLKTPDAFLDLAMRSRRVLTRADDGFGIAPHSLRAVSPAALTALLDGHEGGPVHIHAAEQVKEVEDCLAWSGRRPVQWLLENAPVGPDWVLIHATHMTEAETDNLARSGAVAGLCPTTEADLGDGVFPAPGFLAAGGRFGVGADSHVNAGAAEELRQLEWSQRLALRRRNVIAPPDGSTGRTLYDGALAGGAQALARDSGALAPGRWADLVALDPDHLSLVGKRGDEILDSWIFSGGRACVQSVWSAGRKAVENGRHVSHDTIAARYRAVMSRLMA